MKEELEIDIPTQYFSSGTYWLSVSAFRPNFQNSFSLYYLAGGTYGNLFCSTEMTALGDSLIWVPGSIFPQLTDLKFRINGTSGIVGISDESEDELIIYPNPAKTSLKIGGVDPSTVKRVSLYSVTGLLLKTFENTVEINLSDLSDGLYLLGVECRSGLVQMQQFVKN